MNTRRITPALITALAGACAILGKCWVDTAAGLERVEESRWKRENGMAYYQQAYEDEQTAHRALRLSVLSATNLTELQTIVKGH